MRNTRQNGINKHPRIKGWWKIYVNGVDIEIQGTKKDAEQEYKKELELQKTKK